MELFLKKVENAFGIKSLHLNLENDKKMYQELIYSKNGSFKTSFSNTLYNLSNGTLENVFDRLTDEKAILDISILENGKEIKNFDNRFVVFSREIYEQHSKLLSDYSSELETLTIDKKNSEYIKELLTEETIEIKLQVDNYLKGTGLNFEILLNMFSNLEDGYLDRIIQLLNTIINHEAQDISEINIKKIYQKAYDIVDQNKFQSKISNYIQVLENKINAQLFDKNFNENNCLQFINNVDKAKYLSETKSRGLFLKDKVYYDIDEVKKIFEKEIKKISKDPEIIEQSKEITKLMGTAKESEFLKESIQKNPLLVKQLSAGRKNILLSYLKSSSIDYNYWLEVVKKAKKELNNVLKIARDKQTNFERAIEIYKNRFHPIFDIKIVNKAESMLGIKTPTITFYHNRYCEIPVSETKLSQILSSGEKTTLNILKFIVEYENCKKYHPFIILDDIVETFDYSNRYAFMEYINDLVNLDVPTIVMTHNFEFYRTVSKRIPKLRKSVASANSNGVVDIQTNNRINKNMENVLKCSNIYDFFCAIPYLREIKTILLEDTKTLDSCLHYKENTSKLQIKDILLQFPSNAIKSLKIDENDIYMEKLFEIADNLSGFDDFDIVKKTILSLSCRLLIERKIIANNFNLLTNINTNQTAQLLDLYGEKLFPNVKKYLEAVQLSTPEFIHANAFMYEPLIDINGKYLFELYNQIKKIPDEKIWKNKN
jgi:hypothetical protein